MMKNRPSDDKSIIEFIDKTDPSKEVDEFLLKRRLSAKSINNKSSLAATGLAAVASTEQLDANSSKPKHPVKSAAGDKTSASTKTQKTLKKTTTKK